MYLFRWKQVTFLLLLSVSLVKAWFNRPFLGLGKKIRFASWKTSAGMVSPAAEGKNDDSDAAATTNLDVSSPYSSRRYNLGTGKNLPVGENGSDDGIEEQQQEITSGWKVSGGGDNDKTASTLAAKNWVAPQPVQKPTDTRILNDEAVTSTKTASPGEDGVSGKEIGIEIGKPRTTRRMVAHTQASQSLRGALWHEQHFSDVVQDRVIEGKSTVHRMAANNTKDVILLDDETEYCLDVQRNQDFGFNPSKSGQPQRPTAFYPDIDLSIPESVYSKDGRTDLIWDLLRWEAYEEAQREPLLVSFLYSSILNHPSLESSLAFILANRLQSPAMMISTQLQSLILDCLIRCEVFRRSVRADMMAVRDRDPACNVLTNVFLYFKGFQALQSHRVAHRLWRTDKRVLAQYLQSQVSQVFQIDIHPNATLDSGIMLDHGTGIVIGETASVGHNCSILHHVTLGGSGKKGVDRHPRVGNGVLLGAGCTVLGPVDIGEGSQVGAGTLVISDLPAHCVAVGVPARIIGSFIDVTEQPSIEMNQVLDDTDEHLVAASGLENI